MKRRQNVLIILFVIAIMAAVSYTHLTLPTMVRV